MTNTKRKPWTRVEVIYIKNEWANYPKNQTLSSFSRNIKRGMLKDRTMGVIGMQLHKLGIKKGVKKYTPTIKTKSKTTTNQVFVLKGTFDGLSFEVQGDRARDLIKSVFQNVA